MKYGRIVATRSIADEMENDLAFAREIAAAFVRYRRHDWGDLCQEDKTLNDNAIKGNDRVLAAYPTSKGQVRIITEWDRSATTILFSGEY